MSDPRCRCGRKLIARPGELEPTCGECRLKPDHCDCEPVKGDGIDISDEPAAITGITAAIRSGAIPDIYVRGHQLTEVAVIDGDADQPGLPVGDDQVLTTRDLNEHILRAAMSEHLPCYRMFKDKPYPALPFPVTCKAILAQVKWPGVPRLRGVVTFPVLRRDGSVLQRPGYDAGSGLYLHGRMDMEQVPEQPAAEDVAGAKKFLLDEYLRDFPWQTDADKANYLALLMTPPLRLVINGLFPFADITAPERGSGKTLLAQFFEILYGASMRTLPESDGEMRKSITAALRGPHPVIFFDNIPEHSTVSSPSLAAVLTLPMWTDRILSQSREGTWPNDRLWGATGTNIRLGGDFGQRSVLARIDFGAPRPDLRSGFAIEDIDLWTAANRDKVIRAILILARAWQVAGAPQGTARMRNFTRWAQVLGGILAHHEIPGFLANRDEIQTHDDDAAVWGHFLTVLRGHFGEIARTARDILADAAAVRELGDALPSTEDGGPHSARSLGKALAAHEGRWYGDLAIRRTGDRQGAALWLVVRHNPSLAREGERSENSPNSPAGQTSRSEAPESREFPGHLAQAAIPGADAVDADGEFGPEPNSRARGASDQRISNRSEFGEFEPQAPHARGWPADSIGAEINPGDGGER